MDWTKMNWDIQMVFYRVFQMFQIPERFLSKYYNFFNKSLSKFFTFVYSDYSCLIVPQQVATIEYTKVKTFV